MTRVVTASQLRGRSVKTQRLPREGTRLREIYNRFLANRGDGVQLTYHEASVCVRDLTDYYGCDIRWVGHHLYAMVGETVDGVYVDYVAQMIKENRP